MSEFKPLNLNQKRASQYNKYPGDSSACFFTAWFMYFVTVYKMTMTWVEYAEACKANKAIKDDFFINDRNLLAAAAGYAELRCNGTSANMAAKIDELLENRKPVPHSLDGHHFMSIDGREAVGGVPFWTVDDPAGRDTHANCTTFEVGKFVSGKFVPRLRKGVKCVITKIYWFEEK